MIDGDTSASPDAAARTASASSAGPASLSRNPLAPLRDRDAHVLVEVERGDHHHRDRVGDTGPAEQAGRLEAVELGHADVEQAHVGAQPLGQS